MGWKDWPSWLKGGVILALIDFVILLIPIIKYLGDPNYYGESLAFFLIFTNPLSFMLSDLFEINLMKFLGLLGYALFGIIFYFIIGALIGWIVGKIRNR
ncbi:MAG: hypothetical protein AABW56_00765 [Nanoarchaeota archaeon]